MTSIAEKYAAQFMSNGEVSLADLIQAAVDEAVESRRHEVAMHAVQQIKAEIGQSVPVVGEPVAWVWAGARLTAKEVPGSTVPLFRKPTHSIPAAELANLRVKATQADSSLAFMKDNSDRIQQELIGRINEAKQERDELRKDAERLQKDAERMQKALSDIAEWTDRYTTPGHPVSTIARAAIAQGKGE